MRKMPQIPRDVFFANPAPAVVPSAPAEPAVVALPPALVPLVPEPQVAPIPQPGPMVVVPEPLPVPVDEDKIQVTVYLTPQTAKRLEALRFHLLNEHNVKVSKSALTEYAIGHLGDDLAQLALIFAMGER